MNKLTLTLSLLLSMLIFSCSKDDLEGTNSVPSPNIVKLGFGDQLNTRGTLPEIISEAQWTSSSPNLKLANNIITPTTEHTRTTLQPDFSVYWQTGDAVYLNGEEYTVTPLSTATEATISGITQADSYSGLYPANIGTISGTTCAIDFPAAQPYGSATSFANNVAPAAGYSTTSSLTFFNACGILKLGLLGNMTNVTKARFTATQSDEYVNGTGTIDISGSKSLTISSGTTDNQYIDITFSSAVNLSTTSATVVYFVLPPNS